MELANRLPRDASSELSWMFPCGHVMRELKVIVVVIGWPFFNAKCGSGGAMPNS